MNKDVISVAVFLLFVFLLSYAGHLLYVEGFAFRPDRTPAHDKPQSISVFGTKEECEEHTGASCALQLCDNIPEDKSFEDICGQGFKEVWQPEGGH